MQNPEKQWNIEEIWINQETKSLCIWFATAVIWMIYKKKEKLYKFYEDLQIFAYNDNSGNSDNCDGSL